MVTIDVEPIEVSVTANSKEEAIEVAIKEINDDPNYLHNLNFSEELSEVDEW